MGRLSRETEEILVARFGKDRVIALATVEANIPYVRGVNAVYDNGAFYVITDRKSNKMRQIEQNPAVAISGEWFTAHGTGISLGYFGRPENKDIAERLRLGFSEWIDNGHIDLKDEDTIVLCIKLRDGVLFSQGSRYDIEFE